MSGPDFLDMNVLVYAYDASEPVKQRTAQELIRRAVANGFTAIWGQQAMADGPKQYPRKTCFLL